MQMSRYEILRDSWIYQEIRQEIQAEESERHLQEQRQILLAIVHNRFPRIESTVRVCIEQIESSGLLWNLLYNICTARVEKEARYHLASCHKEIQHQRSREGESLLPNNLHTQTEHEA
jgi:hypothetical protein